MCRTLIAGLLVAACMSAQASDPVFTENSTAQITQTKFQQQANMLGIDVKDVQRYYDIMESPLGNFYKRGDANIFFVLTAEAKTESERSKYAKLWLQANTSYYEKVGSAIRAYTAESIKINGSSPAVFDLSAYDDLVTETISSVRERVNIEFGNAQSVAEFKAAKAKLKAGRINGIDLYFKGNADRNSISRWAMEQNIDPSIVREKQITLNYDNGGR